MVKRLKVLELTNYTAGVCGVWTRVLGESKELSKKFKVKVFSSNAVKGSNKIAKPSERIGLIEIHRFPFKKLGGESFMYWNFKKDFLEYKPDIVMAHSYRHPHTNLAIKYSKITGSRVFLVTHAPFSHDNITRGNMASVLVKLYDSLIAPKVLNKFNKIITITRWEESFLRKLGLDKNKIAYIPNGIPKEFFKQKKAREQNKILFLGRVSPLKSLQTLIRAMSLIKNEKIKLEIVGPAEKEYITFLKELISKNNLDKRVSFSEPIYDTKKKIKKLDSARIFVLPSKREGMPQSLIEAMSRGKIVIASNTHGSTEIIEDGKNGFLFKTGDAKSLSSKLNLAIRSKNQRLRQNAKKSVERFEWNKVAKTIVRLIS